MTMLRNLLAILGAVLLGFLLLRTFRGTGKNTPFPDRPTESLVGEAVITEGRIPETDYDLPGERMDLRAWDVQNFPLALLAELPEADAAFYGLNENTALVRWGNSLAEFDWSFVTPRSIPPRIWRLDLDDDWQDELIIDCYVDGGTGVSIEELHMIEKNADDTLTDFAFPETLWKEQILEMAWLSSSGGYRAYVQMGADMVEFRTENIASGDHSPESIRQHFGTSEVAYFESANGGLRLNGSFCLETEDNGPHRVADYSAGISYQDGAFLLTDFHVSK